MKKYLLILISVGFLSALHADNVARPPLPHTTIPGNREFAKWCVTVVDDPPPKPSGSATPDTSGNPPTPQIPSSSGASANKRTITLTKTRNITKIEVVLENGQSVTNWRVGTNQFSEMYEGLWQPYNSANSFHILKYTKSDFPEIGPLSDKNYISLDTKSGSRCYLFSDQKLTIDEKTLRTLEGDYKGAGKPFSEAPFLSTFSVLIDASLLLPKTMHFGGQTYTYEYLAPPTEMLKPPPGLIQMARAQFNIQMDLNRASVRSY